MWKSMTLEIEACDACQSPFLDPSRQRHVLTMQVSSPDKNWGPPELALCESCAKRAVAQWMYHTFEDSNTFHRKEPGLRAQLAPGDPLACPNCHQLCATEAGLQTHRSSRGH